MWLCIISTQQLLFISGGQDHLVLERFPKLTLFRSFVCFSDSHWLFVSYIFCSRLFVSCTIIYFGHALKSIPSRAAKRKRYAKCVLFLHNLLCHPPIPCC